jgi:hypothetical protein
MTGQLVENVDDDGHDPPGIVTSGVIDAPFRMLGQSMPTDAAAPAEVPMLRMFGDPLGTDDCPPLWL